MPNVGADANARCESRSTSLFKAVCYGEMGLVRRLVEDYGADVNVKDHQGATALMKAVENDYTDIVRYLIEEHGADVNTTDNNGSTILMRAVDRNNTKLVQYLIEEHCADVNLTDNYGSTALLSATWNGNLTLVRLIEEHGANVNVKDNYGSTALVCAVTSGNIDLVRYLLQDLRVDVNRKDKFGSTALMNAVKFGNVELIRFLVDEGGADLNVKDDEGTTVLMWAVCYDDIKLIRFLVEGGANVNDTDNNALTPLMKAVDKGDVELVGYLVKEGAADVNAIDNNASTALMKAIDKGGIELVRFLVEEGGADVNLKDNNELSALLMAIDKGDFELVRFLVEEGSADVNVNDNNASTALMKAVDKGDINLVRYLLQDLRVDVNLKNNFGSTALTNAVKIGSMELIRLLVDEGGADVNVIDDTASTPLMKAVDRNNMKIVQYLLQECHAGINSTSSDGSTALMKAVKNGNMKLVRCLVEQGADVNIMDKNGFTALMTAAGNDKVLLVRGSSKMSTMKRKRYLKEACDATVGKDLEMVKYLILHGSDGNVVVGKYGHALLIDAVYACNTKLARWLIEHDADVNIIDTIGRTMIMVAIERGNLEMIRCLVEEGGADVNATDRDCEKTVLTWAVLKGTPELVEYLIKFGADVNAKNSNGKTAIEVAADHDNYEMHRILVRHMKNLQKPIQTDRNLNWTIHPEELELTQAVDSSNIGGDYLVKWLDADAVVKLFIPAVAHTSFEDEVQLWQQLKHPNVIKLYGACEELQLFVCEFASNGSLIEHVESASKTSTMWKYLYEAALGLEYLHERGIVHGDLRCRNILIGTDGLAKLSNFGLIGTKGTSVGSMRWQAPELLSGEKAFTFASDVYSLGMCILEAESGKKPWYHQNDFWCKHNKKNWAPQYKRNSIEEPLCHSDGTRNLVWRMCCRDPGNRMSLHSVVYELEQFALQGNVDHTQQSLESSNTIESIGVIEMFWKKLEIHIESCDSNQFLKAFEELKSIYEYLRSSNHCISHLTRFQTLLNEFHTTITMSDKQTLAMQLSSTCATACSMYAFHRRIQLLWMTIDRSAKNAGYRAARWEEQRRELFVSGVTDLYLLLRELESDDEKLAFLKRLKTEMKDQYTPTQLETIKNAAKVIESKIKKESLSNLVPNWFIPWYELVVDNGAYLGGGGFGNVFRAKWLDSDVVVKQVKLNGSQQSSRLSGLSSTDVKRARIEGSRSRAKSLELFRKEVDIWFRFSHPHVIKLFGACHVGHPFFVCEYATNGTLVEYLKAHPAELWQKLYEAALGVQYLHARGVVHGDLKGNNIVVGSDKKAKVTDFGLSLLASDGDEAQISAASHWVAPECFVANPRLTFASDVYSLGMCIVEAMRVVGGETQTFPWRAHDNIAVRVKANRGELPFRPLRCQYEEWKLVERMCTFRPEQRIKISTVVDELARLANKSLGIQPVNIDPFPDVVTAARSILATLGRSESTVSMYEKLWDELEKVNSWIQDKQSHDPAHQAFYSLVRDARKCTINLEERTTRRWIPTFEMKMRLFALRRRLSKYLEAYPELEAVSQRNSMRDTSIGHYR